MQTSGHKLRLQLPHTLLLRPGGRAYACYSTSKEGYVTKVPRSELSLSAFQRAVQQVS